MPARDGTGPGGQGPKTGRGLGDCAPDIRPDQNKAQTPNLGLGLGRGRGDGTGRGMGNRRGRRRTP